MRNVVLVALGGTLGAASRFLITHWLHRRWATPFPIGTLTVNVLGCLLIGVAVQASHAAVLSPALRMALVTGLLGGLTTFSTFSHDTFRCLDEHSWGLALANILANLLIGLLALAVGLALGKWLWPVSRGVV